LICIFRTKFIKKELRLEVISDAKKSTKCVLLKNIKKYGRNNKMIPQNLITNEEKEKRERGKERIFLPLIRS
jgi:hypothetical protein